MTMKDTIKNALPGPMRNALKTINWYRWAITNPRGLQQHLTDKRKRKAFEESQKGLSPSQMRLRPDILLNVTPAGKHSFSYFCWQSDRMVTELDLFLAESNSHKLLFDVGGLHGIFSLAFAANGRQAVAFEPSPLAFPILSQHVHMNPDLKVEAVQMAIGDKPGEIQMEYQWQHLVAKKAGEPVTGDVVRVPVQTLDDICRQRNLWPDVMKIDIEGFEYFALKGAHELLEKHHPTLFLEVHQQLLATHGITLNDFWKLLKQYHYTIEDITSVRKPAPEAPTGEVDIFNLLCR